MIFMSENIMPMKTWNTSAQLSLNYFLYVLSYLFFLTQTKGIFILYANKHHFLLKKIQMIIILFSLIAASNSYAGCMPRGHIKFHNRTSFPITITIFKTLEGDVHKGYPTYHDVITVQPHKTISGKCWSRTVKAKNKEWLHYVIRHFETPFRAL